MARALQQDDVSGRGRPERRQHPSRVDRSPGLVEVRIRPQRESRQAEELRMVRPGRLAQPDRLRGPSLEEEVGSHPQRTGSARGLGRHRTTAGCYLVVGSEDEVSNGLLVAGTPVDREVALGSVLLEDAALRLLDRGQRRRQAGFVDVDPDRKVHLVRAAVGPEGFRQTEDRIGRRRRQRTERQGHGEVP